MVTIRGLKIKRFESCVAEWLRVEHEMRSQTSGFAIFATSLKIYAACDPHLETIKTLHDICNNASGLQ